MAQKMAVEWFAERVEKILIDLKRNNNPFQLELCLHGLNELEEQAKQMEREQIMDAYNNGENRSAELYYTQTYGK